MINSLHKQLGQGLIETLLIVLFVCSSILAVFSFQHYLSVNTNISHQQSVASQVGISKIEQLRNYSVIATTSGYSAYQDIASGTSTTTVGNTTYTLAWTVTPTTSPAYKQIDLTVTWTDRNGTSRSVRFVTAVASTDPGNESNVIN